MKFYFLFFFLFIFLQLSYSQLLYKNGNLSTGKIANNGTLAPGAYSWSESQNNAGDTLETNTALGFPSYNSGALGFEFSLADDFIIPPGEIWDISNIAVYVYQVNSTKNITPVQDVRLRIWNGKPDSEGSSVIFGDLITNRFSSVGNSLIYRIENTLFFNSAVNIKREVWKVNATINAVLSAGNYWLEWQTKAINDLPHLSPAVTVKGVRGLSASNAIIHDITAEKWFLALDLGGVDSSLTTNVAQEFPFEIVYNKTLSPNENVWVTPSIIQDKVTLHFIRNSTLETDIRIINAEGRIVVTLLNKAISQGNSVIEIPVSSLAKGIYFINIKSDNNSSQSLKFIKQ